MPHSGNVVDVLGVGGDQLLERLGITVTDIQEHPLWTRPVGSFDAIEEILHAGVIQQSIAFAGNDDLVPPNQPFKPRQHGVVPLANNGPRSEARPVAVG